MTGKCPQRNGGHNCQHDLSRGEHPEGMHYAYYVSTRDGLPCIAYWEGMYATVHRIKAPVPKLPRRK
jgi:hypothetical protein